MPRNLQTNQRYNAFPCACSISLLTLASGTFSVCLNEDHFKDLLFESILPPASIKSQKTGPASNGADLMVMGFPTLLTHSQFASLCSCHSKLYKSRGYVCPRCDSKLCEVPTECGICRLTIVSSPHLARSYRHLFPIGNWLEVNGGCVSFPCGRALHTDVHSFPDRSLSRHIVMVARWLSHLTQSHLDLRPPRTLPN